MAVDGVSDRGRHILRLALIALAGVAIAGCSASPSKRLSGGVHDAQQQREFGAFKAPKYGRASPRVVDSGRPVPKGGGRDMVGRPYRIAGKTYRPFAKSAGFSQVGTASWYGAAFHGRKTANGEIYDKRSFTAAHTTMPLPSYARVTNLRNGHSIVVRVNDRGPFHGGRIIDLSERTAEALDFRSSGTARVKVDYLGRASLGGSDDQKLLASFSRGSPARLEGGGAAPSVLALAGTGETQPAVRRRPGPPAAVAASTDGLPPGLEPAPRVEIRTIVEPAAEAAVEAPEFETPAPEPAAAAEAPAQVGVEPPAEPSGELGAATLADGAGGEIVSLQPAGLGDEPAADGDAPITVSAALTGLYYAPAERLSTDAFDGLRASDALRHRVAAGVFRDVARAQAVVAGLSSSGHATITVIDLGGAPAYRVDAGPFASLAEAKIARDAARALGVRDAVVSTR
jgi:rare lipoprotein A